MRFVVGDIIKMRKGHPCGGNEWELLRVGMDVRLKCLTCGRMLLIERPKFEKAVKEIIKAASAVADN